MRVSLPSLLWIIWIFYFLALEFYAVGNPNKNDTLTENVKALMGTTYWFRLSVLVLIVWLFFHFDGVATIRETFSRLLS